MCIGRRPFSYDWLIAHPDETNEDLSIKKFLGLEPQQGSVPTSNYVQAKLNLENIRSLRTEELVLDLIR